MHASLVLEQAEIEGFARLIYELAKLDPTSPVAMERLARRLRLSVRRAPPGHPRRGSLTLLRGVPTIFYNPKFGGLTSVGFIIAHEIAEWFFQNRCDEHVETDSNRLAAALLAPYQSVREYARAVGRDAEKFAHAYTITQTCAHLRIAEVTDRPTLLVTPDNLYARGGSDGFSWGPEPRGLAIVKTLPDGLSRMRLTDARNRTALFAA